MKRLITTIALLCLGGSLWAQSDPHIFTGGAAIQEQPLEAGNPNGPQIYLQVGTGVAYTLTDLGDSSTLAVGFPWDVLYLPLTFEEDYFEVSKGYFSDKITIDWTIRANAGRISQIKVYRRPYSEANLNDTVNYEVIATLSSDSYNYEDFNIQGGVLYEYKIEAVGVSSLNRKYISYITGIGFRNPTGVVTGNISYEGGNPVKDVVVRAEPQGGVLTFGSSLSMDGTAFLEIPFNKKIPGRQLTLQTWVKLQNNTAGKLFVLQDNQRTTEEVTVSYAVNDTSLTLTASYSAGGAQSVTLGGYYPTGNLDGRGDDLFFPFSDPGNPDTDFANNFAHITVVLDSAAAPLFYLNGRLLGQAYLDSLSSRVTTIPTITTSGSYTFAGFPTALIRAGDAMQGNLDEIRVWSKVLDAQTIRTDFKRYLGGGESELAVYLRCDENAGQYAYDISKVGFSFNKNHARLFNTVWSSDKPTASQLGILGVTDAQGNYIISAIPYSGTGESYTITPVFGVHQFEPAQQLGYIGQGSEVLNKINFKDISSFDFLGVAYYTVDGIFAPIAPVSGVTPGSVRDAGYNQYSAIINGTEQLLSKGEYLYRNDTLFEIPKVYVAGANVYIDGQIVLDKDNRPVETDEKGFFKVSVPIGNHYIEVKKDKHSFVHAGRFPAARPDGNDLFEFFEHQQAAVTFLDSTRVMLAGRVVGGSVEAQKPLGFGHNGALRETYQRDSLTSETVDISSVNNIGQAVITFSYLPYGATPGVGELERTITTNSETGEYLVKMLPINYTVSQTNGVRIPSNPALQLLTADESLNLEQAVDPVADTYVNPAGDTVYSEPYHFKKSFIYRSTPVLNVIAQGSDPMVDVVKDFPDGTSKTVSIPADGFSYPVYTQFNSYAIDFETFEEYVNFDGSEPDTTKVPITDGEFVITNNLALEGYETFINDPDNPNITRYIFRAGLPSVSPPFTRTINIKYRVNGQDLDARNYKSEGIILGGRSDGSQTFVTQAPDYPDIILRDPPGSNSFASIQKGTSISFNETMELNIAQKASQKLEMKLGTKVELGGGLAGPVIAAENVNSVQGGLQFSVESTNGSSVKKTYTFNETISTSSDPAYVGSMADLYIGNSKNYYYGSYDNVKASSVKLGDDPYLALVNADGDSIYISKQKGFYFSEEPTSTFFIYTQKHVLENVIPELEEIIKGIDNGSITENSGGVLSRSFYEEQIRLWKKVIQDNERTKYLAIYDRENYKNRIRNNIQANIDSLNNYIKAIIGLGGTLLPSTLLYANVGLQAVIDGATFLEQKKSLLEQKLQFLENGFSRNVSLDAGVGKYTNSIELTTEVARTRKIKFDIKESFESTFGFKLNETGLLLHSNISANQTLNSSMESEESNSTTVTYTLSDSDPGNFLSVDVINAFDGNGPVFSVIGGRTSCPYEGVDTTLFYNHSEYSYQTDTAGVIYSGGEQISFATQQIEAPMISVIDASVVDVPEERAAEFTLILENNSPAEQDGTFLLTIDNTTNPYNAITNIPPNGVAVAVPYGEQVEYALTLRKSISDVYEYKNIDVVLSSLCDGNISDRVTVSAVFRPSCTAVAIDRPLTNWVYNAEDAYNADNSTNPLIISMYGYDRNYNGFEKFDLQYRRATSSTWTRLRTYYNDQAVLDEAVINGEDKGELLTANTSTFAWDIGSLGLADGEYELRLVSQCANGTDFVSDVVAGTIDLHAPVQFGTPTPTDGILGPGEDLRVQFSEPVQYNQAISKIEIKGTPNRQEIRHNVSVHFEGAANTVTIENPALPEGDLSIEFWLLNQTTGSGDLLYYSDRFKVGISSTNMVWTLGDETLSVGIANDQQYHHYTLSYNSAVGMMRLYQDDQELGFVSNANPGVFRPAGGGLLVVGGNSFVGNLHDLRLWSKPLSLSEAYVGQFNELMGNERNLVGYWPMNEGNGSMVHDKARYNHGLLVADWDIKPRGTGYAFDGSQYLILDDVDFVQLPPVADITLSFWMKTDQTGRGTIFSNGRGDGSDRLQSNGYANKWAVTLDNGKLELMSEGQTYVLTTSNLADNNWHHVALVLRRNGALKTYVDDRLETSNPVAAIGGLSANKYYVGARGYLDSTNVEQVDEYFTGKIDELRLWNLARDTEQLKRDRNSEIDFNSLGLMLYARFNEPDPPTTAGPRYYHAAANETVLSSPAVVSSGPLTYSSDAPGIRQEQPYLSFEVDHVINGDELILTPLVSDWSVLEGQIIDITVDRLFDEYGNRQVSPVTWSAFVRRNEVSWYVQDGSQQAEFEKAANEPLGFTITLLNKGGKEQPYRILNIPDWLTIGEPDGVLAPNSSLALSAAIDPYLAVGEYAVDLYLDTDFNFDEKIILNLRVLGDAPDWQVNAGDFEYNMNIIGKVEVNGVLSEDPYTRVAAFVGNETRGVATLDYDADYDEYFVYLNVFSNASSGEDITFKIWDAGSGKIYEATIDGQPSYPFIQNEVVGYKAQPAVFANTSFVEQQLDLQAGWSWISLFVEDPDLGDLNLLTADMKLSDNDLIKSQTAFDVYDSLAGWAGSLSQAGGLNTSAMYKVKLAHDNTLYLSGNEVALAGWSVPLAAGWNWLAYPLATNVSIREALAQLTASEGDIIKNQNSFAIYDPVVGWSGTLNYLTAGQGYMLRTAIAQTFNYPAIFAAGRYNESPAAEPLVVDNWQAFEHNLNVVAQVPDASFDKVLALNSRGELRGQAQVVQLDGRRLAFLTVFGQAGAGERLKLYLYGSQATQPTAIGFAFTPNQVLGTYRLPMLLEPITLDIAVYPNAFTAQLNVELIVEEAQTVTLSLTDALGRVRYLDTVEVRRGLNKMVLTPQIPKGLYVLTIVADGHRQTVKVVKQ